MTIGHPVRWNTPVVQEALTILKSIDSPQAHRRIVENADLPREKVEWEGSLEDRWRSALEVAAENKAVPALLDAVAADVPALKDSVDKLQALLRNGDSTESPALAPRALSPVEKLGLGLAGLAGSPLDGFEQYLHRYVGTPDAPAPFGGRHDELTALDRWLSEPGRPFALLVAAGGQGKSALLAHWAVALAEHDRADVVLVPISIRFGTAAKRMSLSILGARLRHVNGVGGDAVDPDEWTRKIGIYLRQPREDGRPLVIVLDGADEAADWAVGKDLRIPTVGKNIKFLVSARLTAERDDAGWANALEWRRPVQISLGALGRDGVVEAVRSMGGAAVELAERDDLMDHLLRLSEGDPLMVGLWVEALCNATADSGMTITAEQMSRLKPGLAGFFTQWWEDQQEQWRLAGADSAASREKVEKFLNMCATALGPIFDEEAAAIGAGFWGSGELRDIAASAARLVIGDGRKQGWVFSHPELGQYFSKKVMFADRADFEERYLKLGQQTLDWLQAGRPLLQRKTYGLRYYGAHLRRAASDKRLAVGPTYTLPDRFYELVVPAWQRAWEQHEGGYEGFLADVQRAWTVADGEARAQSGMSGAGRPAGSVLALHARLALVVASVHSVSASLPPAMVIALVNNGIWTSAQAMAFVHRQPEDEQAQTLTALAGLAAQLYREIRTAAYGFRSVSSRVSALVGLAASAGEGRHDLLQEALRDIAAASDPREQITALSVVVPQLPESLLDAAASIASAVTSPDRARILIQVASRLPAQARGDVLDRARAALAECDHQLQRIYYLVDLLPLLPADLRQAEADTALARAMEITTPQDRSRALAVLATLLPEGQRNDAHAKSLDAARHIAMSTSRGSAVVELAPDLEPSLVPRALEVLRSIGVQGSSDNEIQYRARALGEFGARLPGSAGADIVAEAVDAAVEIGDQYWRGLALASLVPHVSGALVDKVVAAASTLDSEAERLRVLSGIASYRDSVGADVLAESAVALMPDSAAVDALEALMPHLSRKFFVESLPSLVRVDDPDQFLGGMFRKALDRVLVLAAGESGGDRLQLLHRAVELTAQFESSFRTYELARLAPELPEPLLRELLASAGRIADDFPRAYALAALAQRLPEDDRGTTVTDGLSGLMSGSPSWEIKELLRMLAPLMTRDQVDTAVTGVSARRNAERLYAPLVRRLADLGELERAIELARSAREVTERVRSLTAAVDGQSSDEQCARVRAEIAEALRSIEQPLTRAHVVLRDLLASEPPGAWDTFLPELYSAVGEISEPVERAGVLVGLSDRSGIGDVIDRTARELLSAARESPPGTRQAGMFAYAARLLDPPDAQAAYDDALSAIETITDSFERAYAINTLGLTSDLPPYLHATALRIATQIDDEQARSSALGYLAPQLPESLLGDALSAADGFTEQYWKAYALAALVTRLAELGRVEEAVNRTQSLGGRRGAALRGILPFLSEPFIASVREVSDLDVVDLSSTMSAIMIREVELGMETATLERAAAIPDALDPKDRAAAMNRLADRLADDPPADTGERLFPLIRRLSYRPRSSLLSDLGALAPLIAHVGGPEAVKGVADAIVETTSWFP